MSCLTLNGPNTQTPPDKEPENGQPIAPENDGDEAPLQEEQWDNIPSSDSFQLGEQDNHYTQMPRQHTNGKNTRAGLKVASLNMKGYGSSSQNLKWLHLNQLMREQWIGILTVQETHMNEDRWKETEDLFSRCLWIVASADPNSPTQRARTAIILNKANVDTENTVHHEIVLGRVLLVTINWSRETKLTILTVYIPNSPSDNARFWEDIRAHFTNNPRLPWPKIMLGDFNMVEDAIDRLPMHVEQNRLPETLRELKHMLWLCDS